jgi:hypothetical protein
LSLPLSLLIGFPVTLSSISLFILYRFGILKDLISRLTKEPISDNIKFIHNRALGELKELAKKLESLDHDKFSSQEFLLFIKIKMALKRGDNQYQKLDLSVKLLEAAIAAQASYLSLEQEEYPSEKYHQSKEFTEEIPGINIYKKYEDYFEGKELFSV